MSAYVPRNTRRNLFDRALTADEMDLCYGLAEDGWSRASIARRLGITESIVATWAEESGIIFDSDRTSAARTRLMETIEAQRLTLARDLMDLSERARSKVESEQTVVFNFGGKENDFNSEPLDFMPAETERAYSQAIDTYVRSVDRLLAPKVHGTDDFSDVDSWLAHTLGTENDGEGESSEDS